MTVTPLTPAAVPQAKQTAQTAPPPALLIKHVDTVRVEGKIPAEQWQRMSPKQRQQHVNQVRGNILADLEQRYPDCIYDIVETRIGAPDQAGGSSLVVGAGGIIQSTVPAVCVVWVYQPLIPEAGPDAALNFARWATQVLGNSPSASVRQTVRQLAGLWAQGSRPQPMQ